MIKTDEELKAMTTNERYLTAISYHRQGYTIENAAKLAKVNKQTLKRKLNTINRIKFEILGHM